MWPSPTRPAPSASPVSLRGLSSKIGVSATAYRVKRGTPYPEHRSFRERCRGPGLTESVAAEQWARVDSPEHAAPPGLAGPDRPFVLQGLGPRAERGHLVRTGQAAREPDRVDLLG